VVVSVIAWELHLDGCTSLKQKRAILRSLKDRLRGRLNVSSDRRLAQQVLSRLDELVASEPRVRIIDTSTVHY
jgi:uncharacterized protein YlxP (DUF503 family)